MKQKTSDGYDWRWRYTFLNDIPQHFSFTVTFGSDGRVKDVTDVWGGTRGPRPGSQTRCLQVLQSRYFVTTF
jgi:hypothetical protein